ncbi:4-hydroxy-tetrahydrodipicolinate reductase [Candidatus Protochlamydia amoebophila]|uniref:4-hydroxy-tetrahydrodipicolinate reductase n=1 Tax=Candidatus Protochlamydia amoebophila TaxID=362787 RepID=UPI001BD8E03F|nr:dihydrodipicolinate reductase C-terminal domain-containing protein [Candidatus Protochlamydia amoebophila]MBS4163979.1 4-hydroxy-tetrahydrodipicolinate reductase [Candidatus Protochlamydia amoebophila]
MKIGLLGYGKIGKLIEKIALEKGHEIIAIITREDNNFQKKLEQVDVLIDFSHPEVVLDHINWSIILNKPIVIGTTGWEDQLEQAREQIQKSTTGCLYSPNFLIGIQLFKQIVSYAAQLIRPFEEFDIAGVELHHNKKLDTPSGTAKALIKNIQKVLPDYSLKFTSIRCGHMPGTHTLYFDSPTDTIILTHEARNREGFAMGAIKAAEWLKDKQGFFTIEDLVL